MTLLRNETFDCMILQGDGAPDPRRWDVPAVLQAIRASGCEDPVVLLLSHPDDALAVAVCEYQCELLVTESLWSSRALVPVLQRGVRLVELARENHQLAVSQHRRLVRERDEADHLLKQQRDIVHELEDLARGFTGPAERVSTVPSDALLGPDDEGLEQPPSSRSLRADVQDSRSRPAPAIPIPEAIRTWYHELLRAYVIMGSGSLGSEITQLAAILAEAGLSPRDTLSLHLERVEFLVSGLGNRSTRHVLARADLLALELVMHLGECYQQQALSRASASFAAPDPGGSATWQSAPVEDAPDAGQDNGCR